MVNHLKNAGGFAAGAALGGLLVGTAEGIYRDVSIPYAALLYGCLWSFAGAAGAIALSFGRQVLKRDILKGYLVGWGAGGALSASALVLVRFIVARDVYKEAASGKMVANVTALGAAVGIAALVWFICKRIPKDQGRASTWVAPFAVLMAFTALTRRGDDALPTEIRDGKALKGHGVILYLVDTLRADALGIYNEGPSATPNIDAFAKRGLVFTDVSAQASWTRPAVASILTSRHASGHDTTHKVSTLPEELPNVASELQKSGVKTGAVVTNYNLEDGYGFDHGYDRYEYLAPARYLGAPARANRLAAYNVYRVLREKLLTSSREARHFYRDARTVNAVGMQILDQIGDGDFFLWLHTMEPHDPYFGSDGKSYARVSHPNPPKEWADPMRAAYRQEVQRTDAAFGELLAALEQRHILERTTIVFVSDHGEEFTEHGGWWHGETLYEEALHVPLIVGGARIPAGVDTSLARQIDVAPTILSLFGTKAPELWEGRELLSGSGPPDFTIAEQDHAGHILQSVRTAGAGPAMKMILANEGNSRGLPTTQLFNLDEDSPEQQPLAPLPQKTVETLTQMLRTTQQQSREGGAVAGTRELDAEAQAELRALGYIED